MHCFQPYDDVPGIQGVDDCLLSGPQWASIDPSLETLQSREDCDIYTAHTWNIQQRLMSFQQAVNGYGRLSPLQIPEGDASQLGLHPTWNPSQPDVYRHMRTVSPGVAMGAYSTTDSITSDEALSPDVRRYPSMAANAYYSPAMERSFSTTGNGSWMPQPLYSNTHASSPYTASEHACNLKDLQYSQDVDNDVEEEQRPAIAPHPLLHLQQPEELAFEDEGVGRSIGDEDSTKESDDDMEAEEEDVDSDYSPGHKRKTSSLMTSRGTGTAARTSPRGTRSLQVTSSPVLDTGNRVAKQHRRLPSHTSKASATTGSGSSGKRASKAFPCTFSHYGCPAIFGSKNEWKRHVSSQHLQLGFWRCSTGLCNPAAVGAGRGHNDFNRKDLFTQHHRRMHLPWAGKWENASEGQKADFDADMEGVRERCWVVRRERPARSRCGVCSKVFEGTDSWEERMEHVGKHFERGEGAEVAEDEMLTAWAVEEGLVVDFGAKGQWLVGLEPHDLNQSARPARRGRRSMLEQNGD